MSDIYKIFEDEIWMPDDFTNCIWYDNGEELSWNLENDIIDLENGDSATYTAEKLDGGVGVVKDPYVIYTLHDGCGNAYQAIFDLRNKKEF